MQRELADSVRPLRRWAYDKLVREGCFEGELVRFRAELQASARLEREACPSEDGGTPISPTMARIGLGADA